MMPKYPKVNYIGNKEKLADWIIENLPLRQGTVIDLFSGGASVSYALKKNGYRVIANDILYSNYILSKAIIENKSTLLNENVFDCGVSAKEIEDKYEKIKFLSERLYFDDEVKELAGMLCISDILEGYEKYLFLSLIRRSMIRKLPYSRMNVPWEQIVKLRDEEYSYKKYGRKRAYHNLSFKEHILDNLSEYNSAIFDNGFDNLSCNVDSFEMMQSLNYPVDIVYMDPPYPKTMNKYSSFYGLFDKLFDRNQSFMDFTSTNTFLSNMEKLIKVCVYKTKYVVISLNNKTSPNVAEISSMLTQFGEVKVIDKLYQYKVTGKENKNSTFEELIILKMK